MDDAGSAAAAASTEEETIETEALEQASATEEAEEADTVEEAIAKIEQYGSVGIIFKNMDTGEEYTYEPDTFVYTASTAKAVFALYICEDLVDDGDLTLDSGCTVTAHAAQETEGNYTPGETLRLGDVIETAIIYSDNDSYRILRNAYSEKGFDAWLNELKIDAKDYARDRWYSYATPETMSIIWDEMYDYLESDSETAAWLKNLLGSTTESFIRTGLWDEDAMVYAKAGWIATEEYNSITDNALIEDEDGTTYYLSIMSDLPDEPTTEDLIANLASTLWATRSTLD